MAAAAVVTVWASTRMGPRTGQLGSHPYGPAVGLMAAALVLLVTRHPPCLPAAPLAATPSRVALGPVTATQGLQQQERFPRHLPQQHRGSSSSGRPCLGRSVPGMMQPLPFGARPLHAWRAIATAAAGRRQTPLFLGHQEVQQGMVGGGQGHLGPQQQRLQQAAPMLEAAAPTCSRRATAALLIA